jgi:hypothetical protein
VYNTRGCKYGLDAPDDERKYRWKHVQQLKNNKLSYIVACCYRVLVGRPKGKRPLGRPRHRLEDNIKMDLQEIGGGRGDWVELAQDRDRWQALVGTVRNFRFP